MRKEAIVNISLEQYKIFYFVGKSLSFSKAAKEMCISQSAVSQSIKNLESQLGCPLFIRTTKQVSFTTEGHLLYEYIGKAYRFITEGELALKVATRQKEDEIAIAASDSICRHMLLPYLQTWQKQFSHIKLKITNKPSTACAQLVNDGSVQMAFINMFDGLRQIDNLEVHPFRTLHDCFVAGPAFKDLTTKPQSLKSMAKQPLILLKTGGTSREYFEKLMPTPKPVPHIELESLDVIMDLVKINMGISFLPREFIQPHLDDGSCFEIPVSTPIAPRQTALILSTLYPKRQGVNIFIDLLKKK